MVLLLMINPVSADEQKRDDVPQQQLFTEPPSPELLADLLFPLKYRQAQATLTDQSKPLVNMQVNFYFDSAQLLPDSWPMLDSVGEMLGINAAQQRSIVIEGHTDAVGDTAYNQKLSELRAASIKDYLIKNYGVAPHRLITVGKGERQLLRQDKPLDAVNRRATFRPAQRVKLK
jgi:outer membrane protein OmpA-like peptidoglycan-associated protein